ncbi:chemotaxis protein [Desulfofundulus sp. TPOSR]|uniref:methyl-accepting chemotaxis protein n=1 Tax=Desulfofundulus sp. TPOSR TaxID=2714340 RepID=UPI00140E100D|nr:chemotaxis protein [Desulfofundulus sp. TPOSR]
MLLFRKKSEPGTSNTFNSADLLFGLSVGRFIMAHTDLLALWSRLRANEAAREAEVQASGSQELSATIEEVNASVEESAAAHHQMKQLAEANRSALAEMDRLLKVVATGIQYMRDQLNEVSQRFNQVNQIGEEVAEIAEQTNLLALNAAIEAARAGEHGRGFAVVAEEVRKLAGKTKDAVGTVKELTAEVGQLSESANRSSKEVTDSFEVYSRQVTSVVQSIDESMKQVELAASALDEITQVMNQVATTTTDLAQSSQRLAQITAFGDSCTANTSHIRETTLPVLEELLVEITEDTPVHTLAARLFDHARFINTVVAKVGTGEKISDHTECAFGRWYIGEGGRQFGHLPAWRAIDEPHRLVHTVGAALVREARAEAAEELAQASLELLRCFVALKKEIAKIAKS